MKTISLWQPWASAVALGAKRIETRSWATNYRGPLAIHAAKRCKRHELIFLGSDWSWASVFYSLGFGARESPGLMDLLPFGALIASCRLIDCRPTESFTLGELQKPRFANCKNTNLYQWTEQQLGDFRPGRYGWILDDICALPVPIPFKGHQGLFEIRDEILRDEIVNHKS